LLNFPYLYYVRAVYYGDDSVANESDYYLKGVYHVYAYYLSEVLLNRQLPIPIVINTQGWIQGMAVVPACLSISYLKCIGLGYHTLLSISQHLRPHHIVHLSQSADLQYVIHNTTQH